MAMAEPGCVSDQLRASGRDPRGQRFRLRSEGCGLLQILWCRGSFGELKFSSRVVVTSLSHARFDSGELTGLRNGRRVGARALTLSSLPLAVISMQTQKPQRAAIPSAGRCVPFSLMQPFQWDGEELADTSIAALQDPGHCVSEQSKTITIYFYLSQTWAAKKPPAHPQLPPETSSWV